MTNQQQPTRGEPRVALVTCTELADLDPDDRLVLAPLAARGVTAEPVVWDDPAADWAAYDLAVLRSPWDYMLRRDEFVAWAARVPLLANPADVVRWNTDKRYLDELSAAGVPTVPTSWVVPGEPWQPPADSGEYVIKPAVSAGSKDTGRYDLGDPEHRELAAGHVRRLSDAGRLTMIQPYLEAVDAAGETALLFLAGPGGLAFSHAIRKGPLLTGPDFGVDGLYRPEEITPRTATEEQLAVAAQTLAAVPGGPERLLYARVDLIPGPDNRPVLVEVELTEPSLFLGHAEGAPDRLAEAIVTYLTRHP
ncbi:ATP-grasp domain-containing protein [Micromonospora sp. URMC 103]|uniref:ATP-grasp domain-containing protein n=1 Tax=Micromonospora sp. URMC 103 TaxID=3423406 RepID=UPI003F199598